MRYVIALVLLAGVLACQTHLENSDVSAVAAEGLILARDEGDRRVRRPRPEGAGSLAAASLIIKVDRDNVGSPNFFMGYEEIQPGASIPVHRHRGYDEILFVHRGQGRAILGAREADVAEGATIYIPSNTRVGLRNTGAEPLQLVFIFPHPEAVSAYYNELTVREGEPLTPFTPEEFSDFRARHRAHIDFE